MLIAAAGNIINDYFDLNIDQINKPEKLIVEKIISRRWVIAWHIILSSIAVMIGFYIYWKTNVRFLGFTHLGLVLMLFLYSISLKKKLLAGNILVSLSTAWVILVVYYCEFSNLNTPLLTDEQIEFYVNKYEPFDKAGAYAIQEWIGVVGIKAVQGDFYNVMGLPVSRVIQELKKLNGLYD